MHRPRPPRVSVAALVAAAMALTSAQPLPAAGPGQDFYRFDELNELVTFQGTRFYIPTIFGPTGMSGWLMTDSLVVREVEKGSPADGLVRPNDVLVEVNGQALGTEPLKTLGEQVEQSEQSGRMTLGLVRGGRRETVPLKLRKLGGLAKAWPFDCAKSRRILRGACEYLDRKQNPDGSFDTPIHVAMALNGMLLLASDDPEYLDNCRRLACWYRKGFDPASTDTPIWGWAYMGIFLAEYYLKTGDEAVLPLCWEVGRALARTQQPSGTWGHGPHPQPGYVQGGSMNPCGLASWVALMLFREAGVPVDEAAIRRSSRFFGRFADRGTVPYGEHRPEFARGGNGKDALASVAFDIEGDRARSEGFARLVTDWYRGRCSGHTGGFLGFIWGNVAGLLNPHRPDYRRMVDYWQWLLNVSRRWDGGFLLPESIIGSIYTNRGPLLATGGVASVFALPNRALRVHGAPRSVFGRTDLPRPLAEGVRLYREMRFDDLEKAVRPDSAEARALLRAARARRQDIELSFRKARRALDEGDPVLARHVLEALDRSCGGREPRVQPLLAEASSDRSAPVLRAAAVYEKYKWLTYVSPEAKRQFEQLAGDPNAGVYRTLARQELATDADDSKWSFYCELMWERYAPHWEIDELARAGVKRIALLKGGNWPRQVAYDQLVEAGYLTTDFAKNWTPMVPHSAAGTGAAKPLWHHYARALDAPEPPKDWAGLDFDDTKWTRGPGPIAVGSGEHLQIPGRSHWQYVRIPFELKRTDYKGFCLCFKLYRDWAKAVVYLNGTPIAWLVGAYDERYDRLDLDPRIARLLRNGRNVLALRAHCYIADVGLYAE